MQIFFRLAFLYMLGSVGGWVIELFFRRFFSTKKWINPGFLNGPYLPMYGAGTLLLYGACFIPLPRWALVLLLLVSLTLLEYVTGRTKSKQKGPALKGVFCASCGSSSLQYLGIAASSVAPIHRKMRPFRVRSNRKRVNCRRCKAKPAGNIPTYYQGL